MPASGKVLEVNEDLRADPSLANTDPEGAGWFCKVQLSDVAELDGLMDVSTYAGFAG
jgi:glycine cleavage system H protein